MKIFTMILILLVSVCFVRSEPVQMIYGYTVSTHFPVGEFRGMPGAKITLVDLRGNVLEQTVSTGFQGYYEFTNGIPCNRHWLVLGAAGKPTQSFSTPVHWITPEMCESMPSREIWFIFDK